MTIQRAAPYRPQPTPSADAKPNAAAMTVDAQGETQVAFDAPPPPQPTPMPPPTPQHDGTPDTQRAASSPPSADPPASDALPTGDGVTEPPAYPKPKLRIEIRDLNHEGADVFLAAVNAAAVLTSAVGNVQRLLYGRSFWYADPATHITPTRSVTVILRDMDGVAYTTGSELDSDHKEIHFSLRYIAGIQPRKQRATAEIAGVLTHELVHCYQWDALGTCPGGLVEGIADWVRLRCALEPPHWKREPAAVGRWDGGYQHTAYFLDYLEHRFGDGTVRRINEKLRLERYDGDAFWQALLGHDVDTLWKDYASAVKQGRPEASGVVGCGADG